LDGWYYRSPTAESRVCDLQNLESCHAVSRGVHEVYNLAADMGGMGFYRAQQGALHAARRLMLTARGTLPHLQSVEEVNF
jgi:hypothetical protein